MIAFRKFALYGVLVLALPACDKEGSEENLTAAEPVLAPAAPSAADAQPTSSPGVQNIVRPTEVAADAVTVGKSLQGDKVVKSADAQFTLADTVYASAAVAGKPAGTEMTVYWSYQDGMSHKMETKKLAAGAQDVQFSFARSDGMKTGKYNVQIDANMTPIGIFEFKVK